MDSNAIPQVPTPVVPPTDQPVMQAPAMVQPVVNAVSSAQPVVDTQVSGKAKEAGPISAETTPTIEVVGTDAIEKEPLPPEVSSWMEKVNRDNSGEKPPEIVVADKTAQSATNHYSAQPVFVLPLGEVEYKQGLHTNVNESVRWLAQWCQRLVKKLGSEVTYGSNH
ncbi:MAG: hypothetical protein ABI758_02925 [Candidatus Woesebacteria bacterium]